MHMSPAGAKHGALCGGAGLSIAPVLILDIFAQRARTHEEGKLQVELKAQLRHLATRLVRVDPP